MLSIQRVAKAAFIEVDGKSVTPTPGHAAICHGPTRGHENDELQARGSPSGLGLCHPAHSSSRIYGRNRLPIRLSSLSTCLRAGSIYDRPKGARDKAERASAAWTDRTSSEKQRADCASVTQRSGGCGF